MLSLLLTVLDEQRQEVENQTADRVADLDRQLNEAKREHTKAGTSSTGLNWLKPVLNKWGHIWTHQGWYLIN